VPLGSAAPDFRIMALDTGTVRPGLEHSTYAIRRRECEQLLALLQPAFALRSLADVRDAALHERIQRSLRPEHSQLGARLRYLFAANQRFPQLLAAWRAGDVATVGAIFRADGIGLLETMVDIVRAVPGVYGERMLGGGDKGASGAIVAAAAVPALRAAIAAEYPRRQPAYADRFAVHECGLATGIAELAPM
jgi:galactokinase